MNDEEYKRMLNTQENEFQESLVENITKNIAMDLDKYATFTSKRRPEKHKKDAFRSGPAPIEDADSMRKSASKPTYGTLDSDLEDLDFEELRTSNQTCNYFSKVRVTTNERGDNLASCRALIVYFSKLAKTKDDEEVIDLNFVDSLIESGADINFPDRHGQTVLHEIARGWHPDIAKFALHHGADINKADCYGRTPLHLAAAVDYENMVEFLVDNGADLTAQTLGELQTPMHYAAKNNATNSIKVMLRLGAQINERDYKRRTPLFVAAETARAEAARFLIEKGAPAGVYDSSGTACLSLMIEKMPQIAMEAVEQFHLLDRAFRKHYYYLSYLEPDPNYLIEYIPENPREKKELIERKKAEKKSLKEKGQKIAKKEKTYAKTPLENIVQYNQLDLIMHPVFQRLLQVKWNLFGKWGSAKLLVLNMFYTCIWTVLGILMPRNRKYYIPIADNWWRLLLEIIGVTMTIYFIFTEVHQLRIIETSYNRWRQWRTRNMEKDLKYCHPRWPEESQYLKSELEQVRTYQRAYFREPWNIFEWAAYVVVLVLVLTRILSVLSGNKSAEEIHPKFYALGLIVIWLRFMRSCRVFRTLGPFIAILGSVISDTLKFAFLFFEFFIPYTVGFWILFGGHLNAEIMGPDSIINYEQFHDLTYSVWMMTLMGPFDWVGLTKVDRIMAQILCGTYFALAGVVCMNLYIALLSDTFARVYAQANANAVMQQARIIIILESKLNKFNKSKFGHYMQRECSPQEVYTRDEPDEDNNSDMFEKVIRQLTNRIDELEDNLHRNKNDLSKNKETTRVASRNSNLVVNGSNTHFNGGCGCIGLNFDSHAQKQNAYNNRMTGEIAELKILMDDIKNILSNNVKLLQPNLSNRFQKQLPSLAQQLEEQQQPQTLSQQQQQKMQQKQQQPTPQPVQQGYRQQPEVQLQAKQHLQQQAFNQWGQLDPQPNVKPLQEQKQFSLVQSSDSVDMQFQKHNQQPKLFQQQQNLPQRELPGYFPQSQSLQQNHFYNDVNNSAPNISELKSVPPRQRSATLNRITKQTNYHSNMYPTLPRTIDDNPYNSSVGQSLDNISLLGDSSNSSNTSPSPRKGRRRNRKKKNLLQQEEQGVPLMYMQQPSFEEQNSTAISLPLLQSQIDSLTVSCNMPV